MGLWYDGGDYPLTRDSMADIVGLTGIRMQRRRMREILTEVRKLDGFVVVGGPWVTVQEDCFGNHADTIFVGASAKRRFQPWVHFADPYCVVPVLFFGSC